MTTFVLVHGAWGGAHTWRSVRPLLRTAGHAVFTPALTGIGERVHLTGPQVGLSVHVDDVANQIFYEDLHDLVLLGFSYGGMVVTGALEHVGDRVRELVYLDAFVPDDGRSRVGPSGRSLRGHVPSTIRQKPRSPSPGGRPNRRGRSRNGFGSLVRSRRSESG